MKREEDNPNMGISQSRTELRLSSLFAWLVGILSKVPSAAAHMPKGVLLELLRRCLLISQFFNKQLVDSAFQITELMDDNSLMQKVQKFSHLSLSNLEQADNQSSLLTSNNIFQYEESIHEADKKLELVKHQILKRDKTKLARHKTTISLCIASKLDRMNPSCQVQPSPENEPRVFLKSQSLHANSVSQNIASALVNSNCIGAVSIFAYGDINRILRPIQHALSSTGVALNHIPADVKDRDKNILVDMLIWALDNPAPVNYLIISGDINLSTALHKLNLRSYNILLVHPPQVSPSLFAAAKVVWRWTILSAGGGPLYVVDSNSASASVKPTPLRTA
ncbi:unnamed protein product [Sphenostylis stenocarpa]|uniref:NYN domain-containing protein n=1 Tax=Sphenostylis stenocarpa TaxID=92480 RepID=A0AA86S3D6_9FABA|nr:unnamed protein product [Sphenostylis stenocarpa]